MTEKITEGMFATEGITKSNRVLHTPGIFAKKHLLYVQEAGVLESLAPHICRRENLESYLIFQVLEGKGLVTFDHVKYELHKGECIWIDCRKKYEHRSDDAKPWKLTWIHFDGNCAKEFYDLFRERNGLPVFLPADGSRVRGLIGGVLETVKENMPELETHSLLTQLVAACIKPVDEKGMLKDVREFVNANYKEKDLVHLITERFQISRQELEKLFEESFGIGLRDYILSRRFHAAKEQMRFTIRPIEEVIEESGIRNEDLFYQMFREYENTSPEKYRKNWAQWMKD